MATPIQNHRAQIAWGLLLAVPDVDAPGTAAGTAQAAGVTKRTVNTQKLRLRQLRAQGQTPTGTWADDKYDGPRPVRAPRVPREPRPARAPRSPRPPRPQKAPRLTPEEKASRKAERMAAWKAEAVARKVEREEAKKAQAQARHAEAVAIQAEAVARQQAEAAAMRQRWLEAKAERDAVPPELRHRPRFPMTTPRPRRSASTATVPSTRDRATLLAEMAERLGALAKAAP